MSNRTLEELGIKPFVLPGGRLPERKSDDAVGYDLWARAIVTPLAKDPDFPTCRKVLFDFLSMPESPDYREDRIDWRHIEETNKDHEAYAVSPFCYRLEPEETVLVDIGCILAMPRGVYGEIHPRSGLILEYQIDVANAPGIIDPDFRGSAGALMVNRGKTPWRLYRHTRTAQMIFCEALLPDLAKNQVFSLDELGETARGEKGFGSTGLY